MTKGQDDTHKLYHEAKRRASTPQLPIKYKDAHSLLLSAPNNIIFELFNTVIKEVSAERLVKFIEANLKEYLSVNWSNKLIQVAVQRLKREQTVDARAGLKDAPAIKSSIGNVTLKSKMMKQQLPVRASPKLAQSKSPSADESGQPRLSGSTSSEEHSRISRRNLSPTERVSSASSVNSQKSPIIDFKEDASKQVAVDYVYNHIMWRVQTDHVTQITSLLIKLVLDDGYKRGKLKVEAYDDVLACFSDWRSRKLIKLYSFGTAPANDQKLILANTTAGDLTKWVANYIDGSEKRQKPDLIRILATALRDKTKNCILITNELVDAVKSLETGAIRCVLLVDRFNQYDSIESIQDYPALIEPLITSGKLFVTSSLNCVNFAPDPANDTCC